MSIRVNTRQLQDTGNGSDTDNYLNKLVKYIPADVVGAWVAAMGIVKSLTDNSKSVILWIAYGFGIVITALLKYKQTSLKTQAIISTGAFAVWVFALGGPFEKLPWYQPGYGSLLLIGYTLLISLVNADRIG